MRYRPVNAVLRLARPADRDTAGRRHSARTPAFWLLALLLAGVGLIGAGGVASAEPTADDWLRLRTCESGNNYAINTGNGYYGAYQFDLGTWRSVGGSGYPNQASPATQDALALTLYRQRGWSPWTCARILGLPVRPDVAAAPPAPVIPAPVGSLDVAQLSGLSAYVAGWAVDPSSPNTSIPVHIYANSAGYPFTANGPRPDVDAAIGVAGDHGFAQIVPLQPGANSVCAFAIGTAGVNSLLGCQTVTAPVPTIGNVDNMAAAGLQVTVAGWAFDPNSSATSIPVHVYVGNSGVPTVTNWNRPDVDAAFGIGGVHGFSVTVGLNPGPNSVCVFAIGTNWGNNRLLSCQTVQGNVPPVGSLDLVAQTGAQAYVAGWAVDPNSSNTSVPVHLYVNGTPYVRTANKPRTDVDAALGISGQHGFVESVPLNVGSNDVCVYGIGVAGNNNTFLGCRTLQFAGAQAQQLAAPVPAAADPNAVAKADPTAAARPNAVPTLPTPVEQAPVDQTPPASAADAGGSIAATAPTSASAADSASAAGDAAGATAATGGSK